MVIDADSILHGGHPMQYTDDVAYNCIFDTYIILLTIVTPINLIIKKVCIDLVKKSQ